MLTTLRKRRLESGLRVKELAEQMSVSPSLVSSVECLLIRPSSRFMERASVALGTPSDELFPEWNEIDKLAETSFDDSEESGG